MKAAAVTTTDAPQPGKYVTFNFFPGEHCAGLNATVTAYKTGGCMEMLDENNMNTGFMRYSCDAGTQEISYATFPPEDTMCMGPPAMGPFAFPGGMCQWGMVNYCEASPDFLRSWTGNSAYFYYPKHNQAHQDKLDQATMVITGDPINTITKVGRKQRMECNRNIVPSSKKCVDTTNVMSMADVSVDFNHVNFNLYEKPNGAGMVTTYPAELPVMPMGSGVTALRYLWGDWYERFFPTPPAPQPSP